MSPEEKKFWDEVASLVKPEVKTELEYRLHYNNNGDIVMCSMADHPESTQYVVVDKNTYDNYFRYIVVDGKLKLVVSNPEYRARLQKSTKGFKVVKNHASLLVEPAEEYTDIEYYEPTNH